MPIRLHLVVQAAVDCIMGSHSILSHASQVLIQLHCLNWTVGNSKAPKKKVCHTNEDYLTGGGSVPDSAWLEIEGMASDDDGSLSIHGLAEPSGLSAWKADKYRSRHVSGNFKYPCLVLMMI